MPVASIALQMAKNSQGWPRQNLKPVGLPPEASRSRAMNSSIWTGVEKALCVAGEMQSTPTGTPRVYVTATGSPLRRISTGWQPAMAFDGSRVVFAADHDSAGENGDGSFEIFSTQADGSDMRQHTRYAAAVAEDPSVSADGRTVTVTVTITGAAATGFVAVTVTTPAGTSAATAATVLEIVQ